MATIEERIEQIEARRSRMNARARAQIQRLRGRLRKRKRREDTRRKVLTGAMLFDAMDRGAIPVEETLLGMDGYLERAGDRALFGLPAERQPGAVARAVAAAKAGDWRRGRGTEDTRRKILAGARLLGRVERGEFPEPLLINLMDDFLSRPTDRALFDLAPRKSDSNQTN